MDGDEELEGLKVVDVVEEVVEEVCLGLQEESLEARERWFQRRRMVVFQRGWPLWHGTTRIRRSEPIGD